MPDQSISKVQPQAGLTYRLTYRGPEGRKREMVAQFIGLETDPVVLNPDTGERDKVSLHFILTTPVIRDLAEQKEIHIDAPADEPIHFHLWPEDLVSLQHLSN